MATELNHHNANINQPQTDASMLQSALGTEKDRLGADGERAMPHPNPPFSVFSHMQKRFIIFIVALTTLIPPLSASIFYPVITLLARELHVSIVDINLTITIYLVSIKWSTATDMEPHRMPLIVP